MRQVGLGDKQNDCEGEPHSRANSTLAAPERRRDSYATIHPTSPVNRSLCAGSGPAMQILPPVTEPLQPAPRPGIGARGLAGVVMLSLVAGLAGGYGGAMLGGGSRLGAPAGLGQMSVTEDSAVVDVTKRVNDGVVTIVAAVDAPRGQGGATAPESSSGSGVVVDDRGNIVTNYHVVEGAKTLTVVYADGSQADATLVGHDSPFTDLAVIRVSTPGKVPVIPLGDSDALVPGQRVVAIGSALGDFHNTVTTGIISGLHRTWRAGRDRVIEDVIQTDTAINSGNSGGPLLNLSGQVIGINTSVIRTAGSAAIVEGIGFAIPSNTVRLVAEQLIASGKVSRPYVGVNHEEVTPALASFWRLASTNGAFITAVAPNSPASTAGIKEGDIITKVGSDSVDEKHPFLNVLIKYRPGQTTKITVNRDGRSLDFEITFAERQ